MPMRRGFTNRAQRSIDQNTAGIVGSRYAPGMGNVPTFQGAYGQQMSPEQRPMSFDQQQLLQQQARQEQMIPLLAQQQQEQERRAHEAAMANARMAQEWQTGGRQLAYQDHAAGADRMFKAMLQGQEYAFRRGESASDRKHRLDLFERGEAGTDRRLDKSHEYGRENLMTQLDHTGTQADLNRMQQERLQRLGHDQTLSRDEILAELQQDRDARQHGYGKDLREMDYGHQDQRDARQNEFMLGRDGLQHEQSLDRMGYQHDLGLERAEAGLGMDMQAVQAQELMSNVSQMSQGLLQLQLHPDGEEIRKELMGKLRVLRGAFSKGDKSKEAYQEAMSQWLGEVYESGIGDFVQPEPTPLERYQQDTFIDPDTGRKKQMNAKGEYIDVDTVSSGGAGSGAGGGMGGGMGGSGFQPVPYDSAFNDPKTGMFSRDMFRSEYDKTAQRMEASYFSKHPDAESYSPSPDDVFKEMRKFHDVEQQHLQGAAVERQHQEEAARRQSHGQMMEEMRRHEMMGREGELPRDGMGPSPEALQHASEVYDQMGVGGIVGARQQGLAGVVGQMTDEERGMKKVAVPKDKYVNPQHEPALAAMQRLPDGLRMDEVETMPDPETGQSMPVFRASEIDMDKLDAILDKLPSESRVVLIGEDGGQDVLYGGPVGEGDRSKSSKPGKEFRQPPTYQRPDTSVVAGPMGSAALRPGADADGGEMRDRHGNRIIQPEGSTIGGKLGDAVNRVFGGGMTTAATLPSEDEAKIRAAQLQQSGNWKNVRTVHTKAGWEVRGELDIQRKSAQ